jgi:hypothetical protein
MFAEIPARKHEIERNFMSPFPFCTNFVNICDMMRRGKKYFFYFNPIPACRNKLCNTRALSLSLSTTFPTVTVATIQYSKP